MLSRFATGVLVALIAMESLADVQAEPHPLCAASVRKSIGPSREEQPHFSADSRVSFPAEVGRHLWPFRAQRAVTRARRRKQHAQAPARPLAESTFACTGGPFSTLSAGGG
jgi:hypothetical protein